MTSSHTSITKEKEKQFVGDAGKELDRQTKSGPKTDLPLHIKENLKEEKKEEFFMSEKSLEERMRNGEDLTGILSGGSDISVFFKMWKENLSFQEALIKDFHTLLDEDKIELTKDYALHITTEIDELLKATGKWKRVLQNEAPPSIAGITEELIDIFKFLINIALLWHIRPIEFIEEFFRKSEVNWTKFKMGTLPLTEPLDTDQKIIVFDLDGVLCKYPEHWINFLQKHVHFEKPIISLEQVTNLKGIAPTLPRKKYDELKRKFREEGEELKVPPMEGAAEITKMLREEGFKIIILTRRPVQEHKRLYADTIFWLKENSIVFDGIFWSEGEKENELRRMFSKMPIVVEDDPDQASKLCDNNFFVLFLDRPYNRDLLETRVQRVHSLYEIHGILTNKR